MCQGRLGRVRWRIGVGASAEEFAVANELDRVGGDGSYFREFVGGLAVDPIRFRLGSR